MWNYQKDQKLMSLVFDEHEYDWEVLANYFNTTPRHIKYRWEIKIYSKIKSQKMIAGAFVWTEGQDYLIKYADKLSKQKWQDLLSFLPGRSYYSLESRWKRIHLKNPPVKFHELNIQIQDEKSFFNHQLRLEQYKRILEQRKIKQKLSNYDNEIMLKYEEKTNG